MNATNALNRYPTKTHTHTYIHTHTPHHAQMEKHVSDLVVAKAITAKIDRPAGVITFAAPPSAEQQLNGWAGNIGERATTHTRVGRLAGGVMAV